MKKKRIIKITEKLKIRIPLPKQSERTILTEKDKEDIERKTSDQYIKEYFEEDGEDDGN